MTRWMPTPPVVVTAMVLLAASPTFGRAQDLLDVFVYDDGGQHELRVDPSGPFVVSSRVVPPDERTWASGQSTVDGRFLIGSRTETQTQFPEPFNLYFLIVHDRVTGATLQVDRGKDFPVFAVHPRRPEILWSDGGGPMADGVAGRRRMMGCAYAAVGSVSFDGSRAVYQCPSPSTYLVVDVDGGGGADLGVSYGPRPALGRDGAVVYDVDGGAVRKRSTTTGAVLALTVVPGEDAFSMDNIYVHPRTGDVFVLGHNVSVFAGDSLALLRSEPTPWVGRGTVVSWVFDAELPRIYVAGYAVGHGGFWIIDSNTAQPLFSTILPVGQRILLRRVPLPARPEQLAATVQGASVTLTWAEGWPVAQALRYVLEVGSAPGLNDIVAGLDVGLQTSIGANDVLPGRYYVRVRAGNYSGLGGPSNEVVVQVPGPSAGSGR